MLGGVDKALFTGRLGSPNIHAQRLASIIQLRYLQALKSAWCCRRYIGTLAKPRVGLWAEDVSSGILFVR